MLRLSLRALISLIVLLLFLIPFYVTTLWKMPHANSALVRIAFYLGTIIWGIRVRKKGHITRKRPLLLISNHFSYLDVFSLGSSMGVRFTPKSEVASWPVIGFFCRITGCVFIDRRPSRTLHNKNSLDKAVKENSIISLFPEGTTNDGTGLLPFKSPFFSIAEQHNLTVQPVSVIYTKLNGKPLTGKNRHIVGWYGDMEFFPHLLVFLRQRYVDVTLVFHDAVEGKDFASRKELAKYCEEIIGGSLVETVL